MFAKVCGFEVGDFVHTIGDAHIYLDHVDQINTQLTREPLPLPKLKILRDVESILDFKYEDFVIEDYEHHPALYGKVSV